jgi:hypothetical protein
MVNVHVDLATYQWALRLLEEADLTFREKILEGEMFYAEAKLREAIRLLKGEDTMGMVGT